MATGSVVKQSHDCTVTAADGAALTASFGLFTGEVTISNVTRKGRAVNAYSVRGKLPTIRHGDREYPTFSLTIELANYSGSVDAEGLSETATPGDVFNRLGTWAAATSTIGVNRGGGDVFTVDLTVVLEGTDEGEAADHTITFEDVHGVASIVVGQPATWQVECTCYGLISGDFSLLS